MPDKMEMEMEYIESDVIFPDEILLSLFSHMNDRGLINMTLVCKRFQRIAKEAFAKKYNGTTDDNYYKLRIFCENESEEHKLFRPFFCTFGESMTAIDVRFYDESPVARDHWLFSLIRMKCTSLTKIKIEIGAVDDLSWLPKSTLTHLSFDWRTVDELFVMHDSLTQSFIRFIYQNHQLQELHLSGDVNINIVRHFNGQLKKLRSLTINNMSTTQLNQPITVIKLENLITCDLSLNNETLVPILNAIRLGCNSIEKLYLQDQDENIGWDDEMITAVCQFGNKLTSLRLCSENLSVDQLNTVVQSLPKLSSLYLFGVRSNLDEVISSCANISHLRIEVWLYDVWLVELPNLNIEWLANFTRCNKCKQITIECLEAVGSTVSTEGEVRKNNQLIYWSGYDVTYNQSTLTLLDLTDNPLKKIIGLLDQNSQIALYNTCKQTQTAVRDFISEKEFSVSGHLTENYDDIFRSFGKDIRSMKVSISYGRWIATEREYLSKALKFWSLINRYCTNLTELTIDDFSKLESMEHFLLPKLTKLTLYIPVSYQILRIFNCPVLTQLKVKQFNPLELEQHLNHGHAFRHLTVLKFGCYNSGVENFLFGLEEMVCHQITELSVKSIGTSTVERENEEIRKALRRSHLKLVNILARFRNLTTLHLLIPQNDLRDSQLLFEMCTKLTEIAVCDQSIAMIRIIKQNCSQIKSIILIRHEEYDDFDTNYDREIYELLPKTSIKIFYLNGEYTLNSDLSSFLRTQNLFY